MSGGYAIREDDQTMASLRRRNVLKRRVKRQTPVDDDSGVESGSESDDEDESTGRIQTQNQPSPSTSTPAIIATSTSVPTSVLPPLLVTTQSPTPGQQSSTLVASTSPSLAQLTTSSASTSKQPTPTTMATKDKERQNLSPLPTELQTSTRRSATTTFNAIADGISTGEPVQQTRAHKSLSHGATVALEVLGILLGISVLLGLAFFFFRRWRKRTNSTPSPTMTTSITFPSKPPNQPFLARMFNRPTSSAYSFKSSTASEANRAARFDHVKPELLTPTARNMHSHHARNLSASAEERTRRVTLKRNTSGKMKPTVTSTIVENPFTSPDDERIVIEASGNWEDARTVARASLNTRTGPGEGLLKPLAGLIPGALVPGEKTAVGNDPTLMSGGLRSSSRVLSALKGLDNRDDGVPYQSGALGNINTKNMPFLQNPFNELEGLREGDDKDGFYRMARERQSMMSGTVRSTTSWNTSVWERLERERENVKGREVFEGGVGGGAGVNRMSTATSVAVWRRPVSWIRDQVERRVDLESGNREKGGMEKLEG